jgi:hypothetical protein
MTETISAVYLDIEQARQTIHDLIGHGFPQRDISLIAADSIRNYRQYVMEPTPDQPAVVSTAVPRQVEGSSDGALLGGLMGLLVGLGAFMIPGIGAAVAAGPLFGIIGAGVGAVTGGILGSLINLGVPEERAGHYAEALRRGYTLVFVNADEKLAERVIQIMSRHAPVDITQIASMWWANGWTRFDPLAEPYTADELKEERRRVENLRGQAPTARMG